MSASVEQQSPGLALWNSTIQEDGFRLKPEVLCDLSSISRDFRGEVLLSVYGHGYY